jgi:hypothetical protein
MGKLNQAESEFVARGGMMSNLADQLEQIRTSIGRAGTSHEASPDDLTVQLEQMRIRMNEVAKRESHLAAELNAAVRKMDDELLREVRSMAAEHEARRANILNELEAFAAQLDGLPDRHRRQSSLSVSARGLLAGSPPSLAHPSLEQDGRERTMQAALTRALAGQSRSH